MNDDPTSRRAYLLCAGTAGVGALAGCLDADEESTGDDGDAGTGENGDGGGDNGTDEDGTEENGDEKNGDAEDGNDVDPLEHDGLVGAHYYMWYGEGGNGEEWVHETPVTPTLGEYDSQDPDVIDQHIRWAVEHGINWFSVSWWGPGGYEDETLKDHVLESPLADELQYSILFESPGLLPSEDGTYDFDDEETVAALVEAMEYLAETYFGREEYLRIDGRPVVTFYLAREFTGDFGGALEAVADAIGEELYVIGDLVYWMNPDSTMLPDFEPFDAATGYNMHMNQEDIDENFVDRVLDQYGTWADGLADTDVAFVPGVLPGYDDTHIEHVDRPDHPIIEASPERFEAYCDGVNEYVSPDPNAVLITSWNEWYENTQIEPHEEFGTEYLEVVADSLAAER